MPATFQQTFLRPGRYRLANGKFRRLTADKIRAYVEGTQKLLAAGHNIPVFLEHEAPGTPAGGPRSTRDVEAERLRNSAGWLTGVAIGADGAATHTLEITDAAIAQKLADQSIKFTSPEFRPAWTDGADRTFSNVVAHVALTHVPVNSGQTPLTAAVAADEALQFSLANWEPFQMSDFDPDKVADDENDDSSSAATAVAEAVETENPDMPAAGTESAADQKLQSVLAFLETVAGVKLPSDTTADNLLDRLQVALMTLEASKSKAAAEESADDAEGDADDAGDPLQEQRLPMQFSLAQARGGLKNRLLAKVVEHEYAAIERRLNALIDSNNITPALRDALIGDPETLQFSRAGEFLPRWTVAEVVDALEKTTVAGEALSADQFGLSTQRHPKEREFFAPPDRKGDLPPEEAKQLVDAQVAKGLRI